MRPTSHTYRWGAALTALLLLVSSAGPLVQHVCAMALHHQGTHEMACCCDKAAASHDPHATHHAGQKHAHDPAPADMPCSPDGAATHTHHASGDCCLFEAADTPADEVVLAKPVPLRLVLPLVAVLEAPPDEAPSRFTFLSDTGPPAPPVALHLVHSVFLN